MSRNGDRGDAERSRRGKAQAGRRPPRKVAASWVEAGAGRGEEGGC